MTLQLDQGARQGVIHGAPRKLVDGAPATAMENIARRVAETPEGVIRSFQADGTLREETFAEVWRRSGEITARLRSLGVGPGSQSILLLGELLDFVACFWASVRVGASAIPFTGVAHNASVEHLKNLVAHLERPTIIADGATPDVARLTALMPEAPVLRLSSLSADGDRRGEEEFDPGDEPDIICLLPTSGSTGSVKLVMLDRRAILYRNFSQNYSVAHLNARILNVFPFEGISGMRALYPTYASLTQMHPRILTTRPLAIFEAIERFGITHAYMTNSMAARLVEDASKEQRGFDLRSLKMVGLGGETVTRFVATRFDALLSRNGAANVLRAGYGSTETSSLLVGADPCACPVDDAGAPILGDPAAGISLRIVGDDGRMVGEGEVGNVEAFAPQTLFSGYWKEPELTRDCMTADGWYKTGDLGAINGGGFSFRGRAKQTLVVGGRKFSLDEIDACLQSDADIDRQTVSFVARGRSDATDRLGVAVAVPEGEALDSALADRVRGALVRRYGFAPSVLMPVRSGEWPLTATGKVDRRALAERAAKAGEGLAGETPSPSPEDVDEESLAPLWREALNLEGDFGRDDNFFDCGGDSLRAAALLISVDGRFGRRFALPEFFALPTFNNLLRLVAGASAAATDQSTGNWPLTEDIRRRMLSYVEGWKGERVSQDRLMFGANRQGSLPPLFCVINAEYEFSGLTKALGPEQPIYAGRSLYYDSGYNDEDLIQALALAYVRDLEQVCPDGPLFVMAHCQGCDIAIAMAQHLLRRGRHVPLLVLTEWMIELVSYPGDVLLLYGRDSEYNPKFAPKFAPFHPEAAWRHMFGRFFLAELDAGHDIFFDNLPGLAAELAQRFAQALGRARKSSPLEECACKLAVCSTPPRIRPGARLALEVSVKNTGKAAIGGEHANLRLGGSWIRDGAAVGDRFIDARPLPALGPGEVAVVRFFPSTPEDEGDFKLALDLFEEHGHSLTALGAASSPASLKVTRRATPIRESLRPYFHWRREIVARLSPERSAHLTRRA